MPSCRAVRARGAAVLAMAVLCALAVGGWALQRSAGAASQAQSVADVCIVAPPSPYDPASGLPMVAPRPIPVDARCPVCGMYPARAPQWAAQVIFDNGDAQFFDSPLSLFTYLGQVGFYSRGRLAQEVAAAYVKDTETDAWIKAFDAVYVGGSSALGPMRAGNYPAFRDTASAQRFAQSRGGSVASAHVLADRLRPVQAGLATPHHAH